MAIEAPFPDLDELLQLVGEAGYRLSEIDATEGAAGNISVYLGWAIDPRRRFPFQETITLPDPAPFLAGKNFIVTGSGRRLREISQNPTGNLGFLLVNEGGQTATLYRGPNSLYARLTSELNSHLAIHQDHIQHSGTNFHSVVHAQPPYLTYLSHIPRYQDTLYMNRRILRWEPESIVQLPEGVGYVPFHVPGSAAQGQATMDMLRKHRVIIWGKHGLVARSDTSVKRAADLIEYAETGARYEYMNLTNGEQGTGLTDEEIQAICQAFNVQQSIF